LVDHRLLIIDPDPKNREEFRKLLNSSGCTLDHPDSPTLAMECCAKFNYDCILVDRDVSETWNSFITDALRQKSEAPPLVFVTGPENSAPPVQNPAFLSHGYLTREPSSAAILADHIKIAVNRIRESVETERRNKIGNAQSANQKVREQFVDSHIYVHTKRFPAPGPVEDIVCVSKLGDHRYGVLLGDCTSTGGTGEFSSVFMKGRIETQMAECSGPSQLLEVINSELNQPGHPVDFMTAVAVYADLGEMTISYSNAGHHPPLHRRWGGLSWCPLKGQDIPLGVRGNLKFEEKVRKISAGDKILLLSDGFLKIRRTIGTLKDGVADLSEIDLLPSDAAPNEIIEGIQDIVASNLGGKDVADEVTATLIQI
jgi:CheY-like chemotaxis protein